MSDDLKHSRGAIAPTLAAAGERQTTGTVLMVRPAMFGFNPEAAATNQFADLSPLSEDTVNAARREFDGLADRLRRADVEVLCLEDTPTPSKRDAVFSNNWVTTHHDATAVIYPMAARSRRCERRPQAVEAVLRAAGFRIDRWVDLSSLESRAEYLEGTGSIVLDRPGRQAYACLSERTHPDAFATFAAELGYRAMPFVATDPRGRPIYHTNVMMSLGRRFAAVCLQAVREDWRATLVNSLEQSQHDVVELGWEQVAAFAGNMLELSTTRGDAVIALSSSAYRSLSRPQRLALERLGGVLVHAPLPVIEHCGGGSARCMITEVHLPRTSATARPVNST